MGGADGIWIQRNSRSFHLDGTFEFYFQQGLNFYSQNNFMSAYETFFSGEAKGLSGQDRLKAELNKLFCLDNLGYEVAEQFSVLKENKSKEDLLDVKEQIEAFDLRLKFRRGEVTCDLPEELRTQEEYLRAWLNQLPYNKSLKTPSVPLPSWLKPHNEFYKRRDRLGTIFQFIEGQSQENSLEDLADRFYLWIWRWICNGDVRTLKGVLQILVKLNSRIGESNYTFEDIHLISNGLKWLKLFLPQTSELNLYFKNVLQPFTSSRDYELFHFENDVIEFIESKKEGREGKSQSIMSKLIASPIWKNTSNLLPDLVKKIDGHSSQIVEGTPLQRLFQHLAPMIKNPKPQVAELIINLEQNTAFNSLRNEKILSSTVATAFKLLFENESISFEEMARHCFKISNYDEFLLQPRIFNLISRMKKVAPTGLNLKTKLGRLYCSGSWDRVCIIKVCLLTEQLRALFPWQELSENRRENLDPLCQPFRRGSTILKKLADKKEFSRKDLENLLGTSKSTAYRTIKCLLAKGYIKADGSARKVRYTIISPQLFK